MKQPTLLIILFAATFPQNFAASQRGAAPFSVTVKTSQDNVKAGSEIGIRIILQNTSATDLSMARSNGVSQGESHYLIDVRDSSGLTAPETEYERRITGKENGKRTVIYGSDIFFTLKPHETLEDEALLNKLYDLRRPGKYTVQVSREIPKQLGGGTVKSNILTITVVEPTPEPPK
ncbi:MAG TPA: hypothetical protein VJN42_12015 [Candidatus Acidoferrum sp.]|nr:hypothetical protein [Candidatus Acidoferrum sp.]